MTDDGSLLLRAILESPEEDAPRLILADYLDALPTVRVPCGNRKCEQGYEWIGARPDDLDDNEYTCASCGRRSGMYGHTTEDRRMGCRRPCRGCAASAIDTANTDLAEYIRGAIEQLRLQSSGMLCHIPDATRPRPYDVEELPYHCLPRCLLCRSIHLSNRLPELLARHEFAWASPLGDIGWQANSTWVPACEWEFTRGFVSEITLSLADFMDADRTAAIFARHPITRVKLEDRSPWGNSTFGTPANPYGWQWSLTWNLRSSYHLPPAIWDLMDAAEEAPDGVKCFPKAEAAHDALSLAAVNYGRSLAKLPPLPLTSLPTGV